jgi:hypothetical protein
LPVIVRIRADGRDCRAPTFRSAAKAGRFDGFHAVPPSVSKTCLVRFDNNKYSVAASAVARPVKVHADADRVVIRQDGACLGRPRLRWK